MENGKGSLSALFPFVVFLILFVGSGIITDDFYHLPVLSAVLVASAVALLMNRKFPFADKVERFAQGAGQRSIIIMVFIFLLAGAFGATAKGMGAVDSTVNLALSVLPEHLLVVGLFIIAAFISLAMGTSVGTIATLAPIAVGISTQTGISPALTLATVVGGAMFGDNLSIISDTTIAAVRTQHTNMKDKFRTNFFIVLPAAIATLILLFFLTPSVATTVEAADFNIVKILPYIGVLIAALWGVHVITVLAGGIFFAGVIGLWEGNYTISSLAKTISEGISGMSELILLTLLIGGLVEIIRANGGLQYLLYITTKKIKSKIGAAWSIAGLVSLTNLATANNTIAILTAGPLAKDIADHYNINPKQSASLLDIFSCAVQGLIPYGAQILIASQAGNLTPVALLSYSFYPLLIALCGVIAIYVRQARIRP
ncbi:Na+/H+ antiporter NhaC family protein [Hazenella sp. IB182357]|uniref:Na+/H+ antiporter NhaC family protein n=1 Tax=Polycladospora coralii TaxID=2771432 RepID=A0A926RUP2_9BACL|nr:Na+/H+ antiporter NhaC family protein [Polycladospora coralii]MBD1372614.1 Na+/H+ antiporter NhaC family protein [Polycladospora coralii]